MGLRDLFRRPTVEEKFANLVEKHLRGKGWLKPITYDPAQNALLLGDGEPVMFLDNLFQDWSKAPTRRRGSEIEKATAWLLRPRPGRDYDAVREKLLPAVRNRSHIEELWLDDRVSFGRDTWQGAYEALCEDLAVIAVVDLPDAMTLVDGKILQEWNRPLRSVLDQAIENLRAVSPVIFVKHEAGFFISGYGDHHDTARLMLPDIFERLPVSGAPVAIPVERSGLVVAGEDDTVALLAMAEFAEARLTKATRPTAFLPLVLRERRWQRFAPTEPALAPLRLLAIKQRLWDYGEQKAMMDRHFERCGRDVFGSCPQEWCKSCGVTALSG